MSLKEEISRLEKSSVFREFRKKHPDAYLAHAFISLEKGDRSEWQLGYYLKKKDRLVTFFMLDKIKKSPESKIFKEPGKTVRKLNMGGVASFARAFTKCMDLQKEKYPSERPAKLLAILQNIDEGTVYNFTLLTPQLKTLNIKIDAATLKVKGHKLSSLMDFRAK